MEMLGVLALVIPGLLPLVDVWNRRHDPGPLVRAPFRVMAGLVAAISVVAMGMSLVALAAGIWEIIVVVVPIGVGMVPLMGSIALTGRPFIFRRPASPKRYV